jgi:hypothetical protein
MTFSDTEYDAETRALMTAAHNTAWTAICVARAPSDVHQAAMASAIVNAVLAGERDFMRLQQTAIDAFDAPAKEVLDAPTEVKAVDRRQGIRLVSGTDFVPPR